MDYKSFLNDLKGKASKLPEITTSYIEDRQRKRVEDLKKNEKNFGEFKEGFMESPDAPLNPKSETSLLYSLGKYFSVGSPAVAAVGSVKTVKKPVAKALSKVDDVARAAEDILPKIKSTVKGANAGLYDTGNKGIYTPEYEAMIKRNRASAVPFDYDVMQNVMGATPEIKGNMVKIYRLTTNGKLLPGDNVSIYDVSKFKNPGGGLNETAAKMGITKLMDNPDAKLVTKWIPKKDLYQTDAGTQLYAPNGVKSAYDVAQQPIPDAIPPFEGFDDLTLKTLEKLKGRSTVSKQFISDLTNSGDIKQAERDAIRQALEGVGDQVNVPEFANAVKSKLLPLTREGAPSTFGGNPRYENITLPSELRGNVSNYGENIYGSPVKTSAGNIHFSASDVEGVDNYFGHSRVEDLPGKASNIKGEVDSFDPNTNLFSDASGKVLNMGDTRRVIEIQSDLFQKGRLDEEVTKGIPPYKQTSTIPEEQMRNNGWSQQQIDNFKNDVKNREDLISKRQGEVAKLKPYENTWHERLIKEEVKKAAQDGKTKLQFPVGETAMKIEGLGENADNWVSMTGGNRLRADSLKVGEEVGQTGTQGSWIITDVLGDGKFKALPKEVVESQKAWSVLPSKSPNGKTLYLAKNSRTGEITDFDTADEAKRYIDTNVNTDYEETFDISGKVDENNPIYKFYEKEVGRYLTNKYGAKRVKDAQGVEWWEVDVPKEKATAPIEAFGLGAMGLPQITTSDQEKDKNQLPPSIAGYFK